MRNTSLGILSHPIYKWVVVGFAIAFLVGAMTLLPSNAEVAQAGCTRASAYAHWHHHHGKWKRGVYVYSPGQDRSVQIWFEDRWGNYFRVADSDTEINQSSPTGRDGEWQVHHIATRFKPVLDALGGWNSWDDDWRWFVKIC